MEKMDALGKCVRANRGLRVVALYEINSTLDCVGIIKELGNGGNNWNSGGGGVDFLSDLMANTSLTSSLPPPVLPPQSQLPPPPFADDNYNEYLNNNNNWEEDGDENGDEDVRRLDYDYDDHDDDDDSDSWSYSSTVSSSSSSTDVNAAPSGGGSSQQQRSSSSSSSSSRQQHGHRRRRLRISHRRAHLRELELDGVGFLRTLLPHLTQFSHLTRLKLYPSRRAASFFANDDLVADILRHTPRLQHLDVPILGDGPIARAAEACPLLEYFDLVSGRDVTDSALILLVKRCQRLAHVRLGSAPLISDNAMIVLARSLALNLKRLVCPFGNVRLTTRTLEALGRHCGRLEGLGNVPAAIDFNALMFHLPKLTRLLVVGLCVMPPTVGGGGGVGGNGSALLLPTPVSASSPSSSSSSPSFGGGSGSNGGGVGINTGSGGHESRQFGCSAQLPLSLSPASRAFGLVKEDQDRLKASCKRLKHIIISF